MLIDRKREAGERCRCGKSLHHSNGCRLSEEKLAASAERRRERDRRRRARRRRCDRFTISSRAAAEQRDPLFAPDRGQGAAVDQPRHPRRHHRRRLPRPRWSLPHDECGRRPLWSRRRCPGTSRPYESKFGPKSLDEPITPGSAMTLLDRLASVGVDLSDLHDGQTAMLRRYGRVNSAIEPCSILYDCTRKPGRGGGGSGLAIQPVDRRGALAGPACRCTQGAGEASRSVAQVDAEDPPGVPGDRLTRTRSRGVGRG